MSEFVQKSLSDVYFDVSSAEDRYASLQARFLDSFGAKPDFMVRSPGRVNIIGDHIDYSFFNCLPAAISFDVVMAVRVLDAPAADETAKVELVNLDSRFPSAQFDAVPHVQIEGQSWANYFKCSWVTGIRYLRDHGLWNSSLKLPHVQIAVSGNVPAGGGLSSSAAFVVTGTLATLRSIAKDNVHIDHQGLTKLSATCEQLVGVNSGGMDQAASIFGKKDHALLVSFRPDLTVQPMRFPSREDPLVFLIANSLVVANKLETAPIHYNLRVVEVTVAANILAKKLGGLEIPQDGNLHSGTLYGVLEARYGASPSPKSLTAMVEAVEKHLDPAGYTREQVAEILEISVSEVEQKFMSEFPVRFEKLQLYQRAKHVYEETLRVLDFVDAMQHSESVQVLGDLMNASQDSAIKLYENSHPDCDEMCRIARSAGSLGSRTTGAGWGGCTVHLVERSRAETVRRALETEYYAVKHPNAPKEALVESRPSSGVALFEGPF